MPTAPGETQTHPVSLRPGRRRDHLHRPRLRSGRVDRPEEGPECRTDRDRRRRDRHPCQLGNRVIQGPSLHPPWRQPLGRDPGSRARARSRRSTTPRRASPIRIRLTASSRRKLVKPDPVDLQTITTAITTIDKTEHGHSEFPQDTTFTKRLDCNTYLYGDDSLSFPKGIVGPDCAVAALGNIEILGPLSFGFDRLGHPDSSVLLWAGGDLVSSGGSPHK